MISLILPPKDQVSRVQKMLADEYGTASNIKSRVNRQSVLGAITSAQQRLKLYTRVPANGLVLFTGTILTEDGKEKRLNIDFEPFKPINTSLYLCDNKFHTEALAELLDSDSTYGFIIMDGNGALFGTLSGNTRDILHKFSVDLPKKHGRGGQSALRFARLRMEKRHNYVRKVAETAVQVFIPGGDKANVAGLVLAGSAEFKNELSESDMFDGRLKALVLAVVDVSYGAFVCFSFLPLPFFLSFSFSFFLAAARARALLCTHAARRVPLPISCLPSMAFRLNGGSTREQTPHRPVPSCRTFLKKHGGDAVSGARAAGPPLWAPPAQVPAARPPLTSNLPEGGADRKETHPTHPII